MVCPGHMTSLQLEIINKMLSSILTAFWKLNFPEIPEQCGISAVMKQLIIHSALVLPSFPPAL